MGSNLKWNRGKTGQQMDAPPGAYAKTLDEVVRAVKPRKPYTKRVREVKMPTFKGGL